MMNDPWQIITTRVREAGLLADPRKLEYGTKLSKYVIVGVDNVASPDTGEVWLHEPLLRLFDQARLLHGTPIPITAGSRTHAHQMRLIEAGYKAASQISPHELSALDLDARPTTMKREAQVNQSIIDNLQIAARMLDLPPPRLGFATYRMKFTHVDLVFLFFQPYTTLPHPGTWEELPESLRRRLDASWREGTRW